MKKQKTEAKINLEALAGGAFAEKLNEDTKAKHPDWELIDCPNCGSKCWKAPEADRLKKEQGVQWLCTRCALEAGLVSPYRQNNTPHPEGNRAQRRRAKREKRKK